MVFIWFAFCFRSTAEIYSIAYGQYIALWDFSLLQSNVNADQAYLRLRAIIDMDNIIQAARREVARLQFLANQAGPGEVGAAGGAAGNAPQVYRAGREARKQGRLG